MARVEHEFFSGLNKPQVVEKEADGDSSWIRVNDLGSPSPRPRSRPFFVFAGDRWVVRQVSGGQEDAVPPSQFENSRMTG